MDKRKETWAAITRTSHVGGREADRFHADEDQMAEAERYAGAYGRAHGIDIRLVWMEPEMSVKGGAPIEVRPGLRAAIEGVEAGEFDAVVTANLRRLTRSRSGHVIWERVEGAGGRVHCARENLDTSTPYGRKVRDREIADAVCEREEFAEMHAERRRKTVEAGIWRQRQTPYPYEKDPATRKLTPNSERARKLRQAAEDLVANRVSITEVARRLGMTPSGARQLLRNRVLLGELRDGGRRQKDGRISPLHVNRAAHRAVLDADLFDAVQAVLDGRPRPGRSESGEPALLAGLVRCAGCGHVMTRRRTANVVYGCSVNHSGERCPAPASITCAHLDAHVERIALLELERLAVTATEGRGLEHADAEVAAAERELAALLKTVTAAGLDERDYAAELRERKDALEAARDQRRAERARRPVLPTPGTAAAVWMTLNGHQRNELLRGLLATVVVTRAGRGRRVPVHERTRVLRFGADIRLPTRHNGGRAAGIVSICFKNLDRPSVLGLPSGEDVL